jgi:hypothetical protein
MAAIIRRAELFHFEIVNSKSAVTLPPPNDHALSDKLRLCIARRQGDVSVVGD